MSGRVWFADDTVTDLSTGEGVVFVGVIEWDTESGEDPDVQLARTVEEIERWYIERLINSGAIDPDVLADLGMPPTADVEHAEVIEWMTAFREDITDAWLTIYRREVPS